MNQKEFMKNVEEWSDICLNDERIDLEAYDRYEVKRGLRDKSGDGVV
ncbi:MAG TPA: citrate synthase, partial [Lachnoclostridium sp.]|nr:citrate synthase [Lachnoclostridium sp.]